MAHHRTERRVARSARPFRVGRVLTVLLLGMVLVASACASSGDGASSDATQSAGAVDAAANSAGSDSAPSEGAGSGGDESDASASEDEEPAASREPSNDDERLDDYFNSGAASLLSGNALGGGLGSFDQRSVIEEQQEIEQATRECMVQQGFEYEPSRGAGAGFAAFFEATEGSSTLDAQTYASQEGFGISTIFDAIEIGVGTAITAGVDEDANTELLAEMSEGERSAWFFALTGEQAEFNDEGLRIDPDSGEPVEGTGTGAVEGGCRFDAQASVREDFIVLGDLAEELEELDDRVDADTRILEIRREWSACMSDGGFLYATEDEARDEIQTAFIPYVLTVFSGVARGSSVELSEQQETDLSALQEKERSIATASYACKADSEDEIDEIRARYEAEFISTNRDVLESLRD